MIAINKLLSTYLGKSMPILVCKMMPAWEQIHKDTIGTGDVLNERRIHLHFEHLGEMAEKVIECCTVTHDRQ